MSKPKEKIIGIVGGIGPYAGLELAKKIFDQTKAQSDQEHLTIILISMPAQIGDRTSFLLNQGEINPAFALFHIIRKLEDAGATVVGIPCNTAHAPQIYDIIVEELIESNSKIKLVNMIEEVRKFILENYPNLKNVGVLCTTGTYKTEIYRNMLNQKDFHVIMPNEEFQDIVHKAIYNPRYGIKAQADAVTKMAKKTLLKAFRHLQKAGAEAIILGCTEISLAITANRIGRTVIIDPSLILARALIKEVDKNKLKI